MDWKQIQEKLEMVINTNRQDNTVKTEEIEIKSLSDYSTEELFEELKRRCK